MNLICVSPSLPEKAEGEKPALCKPRKEETALWCPTASPSHPPSTLVYLKTSTGSDCQERSFRPCTQDLSKLLVLEIRPGFGRQRHSFGPFGLMGATQAAATQDCDVAVCKEITHNKGAVYRTADRLRADKEPGSQKQLSHSSQTSQFTWHLSSKFRLFIRYHYGLHQLKKNTKKTNPKYPKVQHLQNWLLLIFFRFN